MEILKEESDYVQWQVPGGYLAYVHVYIDVITKDSILNVIFFEVFDNETLLKYYEDFAYSDYDLNIYVHTSVRNGIVRIVLANGTNVEFKYLLEFLPTANFFSFLGLMFFGSLSIVAYPILLSIEYLEKTRK